MAEDLGISKQNMMYGIHDNEIAVYRNYIESPLKGETPVYEELFHLTDDPLEALNLANSQEHQEELVNLRKVWNQKILEARGEDAPKVLRYTKDSQGK